MNNPNPIHFTNPPLNEVVIGIQFSGLKWQIQHFGSFFEFIKSNFPIITAVPPLPQPFEQPGLKILSGMELPRVWYKEANGPFLLQVQQDRFLLNWRESDSNGAGYPHFSDFFNRFKSELNRFEDFCKHQSLGQIKIENFELTYINHFAKDFSWKEVSQMSEYFNHLQFLDSFPTSKMFGLDLGYLADGFPVRHTIKKGTRNTDGKEIFVLDFSITDRVTDSKTFEETLRKANITLAQEFARLVTKDANHKWGRV